MPLKMINMAISLAHMHYEFYMVKVLWLTYGRNKRAANLKLFHGSWTVSTL